MRGRSAADRLGRGEEQVLLAIDEHTGHAWQIRYGSDVRPAAAVQHVHPIGAGVGDVDTAAGRRDVGIGVIEAWFRAGRHGREANVPQRHAAFASTFFWQNAYSASRSGRDASRCFWSFG